MTTNRSSEELRMRELIVPELRRRYPSARIIHELPLRYSTNRIDLAAITETEIISVEIKSSKDVTDRLEAQLRGFMPICSTIIVALAPKWNEQLPALEVNVPAGKGFRSYTAIRPRRTEAQEIIYRVGHGGIGIWTVDAGAGSIAETERAHRNRSWRPWLYRMLDVLHVSELITVAARHRTWSGKRPTHDDLVQACADLMTGREIVTAVCRALRERNAFAVGTDAPSNLAETLLPGTDTKAGLPESPSPRAAE